MSSDQAEQRNVFVVFTNSAEDADDEFNSWYDEHHIHDLVGVDGFTWGQRYRLHPDQRPGMRKPEWDYFALYEIEGDVTEIHQKLALASPGFVKSATLAPDSVAWVFSPVGDQITKSEK